MRNLKTWLTGLLGLAAALLLPMAALGPCVGERSAAAGPSAACADGSANLAMGCAGTLL